MAVAAPMPDEAPVTSAIDPETFMRSPSRVDGDLDRPRPPLVSDGVEGVLPRGEAERVGQHAGEVDASVDHQIDVVLDAMLAHALDLLDAKGVRADPADLLEVERAPLPPTGRGHTALHQRAPRLEHSD